MSAGLIGRRLAAAIAAVAAFATLAAAELASANTFPGGNGLIGFSSDRPGTSGGIDDIFTVNGSTNNLTQTGSHYESAPTFNPLGDRIAFSSSFALDGTGPIIETDPDGGNAVTLFDAPTSVEFREPSYSPNLQQMAFFSSADSMIHIGDLGDGTHAPLTAGFDPSFFPSDPGRIVFNRYDPATMSTNIYAINLDGTGEQMLVPGAVAPNLSPDGGRIVYQNIGDAQIYIANADGSSPAPLTLGNDPVFSPDGNLVAFSDYSGGTPVISTIPVGGGSPSARTTDPGINTGDQRPTWQPIPAAEICDDGIDNDNDTLIDAADVADCPPVIDPNDSPPTVDTSRTKNKQPAAKVIKVKVGCDTADGSDCKVKGKATVVAKRPKGNKRPVSTAKKRKKKTTRVKLKPKSKTIADGKRKTLKFKISKKAKRAAKRALKAGGKAFAKVKLTVTDGAGNVTKAKLKIKLKNPKKGKKPKS